MTRFFDTGAVEHMSSRTTWTQEAVLCLQHEVGVNTVLIVREDVSAGKSFDAVLMECRACCRTSWTSFFPMCEAWHKIVAAGGRGIKVSALMDGRDHFGKISI